MRWLSSLTPVTYLCTLLGIHCVAAFLQLELFWGYLTVKLFYLPAVPALHPRWWCAPDVRSRIHHPARWSSW
ncbi:hypothetical protein BST87_03830 [Salmonella enterica subsp. enterica serovar Typhi]|nr:hypothetical protein BST88_03825 [Salmonella enterica subsp. enterica serovar Typhi]OKK35926.1 hypothetical protein BST87_03830 [Salmonella enterica subsp. enterica serovar Typhi]OKK60478.1 hypothetical protein BST90_03825 [Salmonella enterica subsp. enterica serovar Typhi]